MKNTIYEIPEYDRYILVKTDHLNNIIDLDFYQGLEQESLDFLINPNKEINRSLLEIYNRFVNYTWDIHLHAETQRRPLPTIDIFNHCIELYVKAFIIQDTNEYETIEKANHINYGS